jgi:hypothetical protein
MARKRRRQPVLRWVGLFLAVVLLVTGVVLATAMRFPARTGKATNKSAADYIRAEIKALEKLLQDDIHDSRIMGKTDAQIEEIKAKYQAEIDRLNGDIEKLEQEKNS